MKVVRLVSLLSIGVVLAAGLAGCSGSKDEEEFSTSAPTKESKFETGENTATDQTTKTD